MARKVTKLFKTTADLMAAYFPEPTAKEREQAKNLPKEFIKLRAKTLTTSLSLYLDYYKDGKRQYEFLRIYLNLETDAEVKEQNRQKLEVARTIQQEKIVNQTKTGAGFIVTKKTKINLIQYIQFVADEALKKSGNKHSLYYHLLSLSKHIEVYKGSSVRLADVDKDFILGFIEYLKTARNQNFTRNKETEKVEYLSQNFQHLLFMKLRFVLGHAVKSDILASNPIDKIDTGDRPKGKPSTREFLCLEEIKVLIRTECKNEHLKRAFLFCCLVGLRYSDVSTITWKELTTDIEGDTILRFTMKKVGREQICYISDEAIKWLPERGKAKDDEIIFDLPRNDRANVQLSKWMQAAGITKKITFHCSRHTAATLNLALGVSMEIVSKMLGHTKLSTTQIYAKILDKQRKEASNKQNGIFD